jgi:PAS domain S-box-containing protein
MSEGAPTPPLVLQALLGEASECAAFGVSVYDDDGRFVAMNDRAAQLLGYSRDELLTHDVADFTTGGIDRSLLLKAQVREGVRRINRKDGTSVPVAFVVAPTRVATRGFFISTFWELPDDDPRALDAG